MGHQHNTYLKCKFGVCGSVSTIGLYCLFLKGHSMKKKSKLVFFSEIGEYGFHLKATLRNALNNNNNKKARTDIFNNSRMYGHIPGTSFSCYYTFAFLFPSQACHVPSSLFLFPSPLLQNTSL